jgi:hypothetical protein
LLDKPDYRRETERILLRMKEAMARQPTGFGRLLGVLESHLAPSQEIAIVGPAEDPATVALLSAARRYFLPGTVLALQEPGQEAILPLLTGRALVDGRPTAYVCENYSCQLPLTSAEALAAALHKSVRLPEG